MSSLPLPRKMEAGAGAAGGLVPAAPVDEQQLFARLHELLDSADLSTLTERQLRQTLERELGASLETRKEFIRKEACTRRAAGVALVQGMSGSACGD